MKKVLLKSFLIVCIFLVFPVIAQESLPDLEAALKPMNRFVGTWEKQIKVHQSEWAPEDVVKTGTHTSKWILDNHHLQENGNDSDGMSYQSIYSYDSDKREYRVSVFQANGSSQVSVGKWDEASNTFSWSSTIGDRIPLLAKYRFVNIDQLEFSFLAKDAANKIYLHVEGTGKRAKARGN